MEKDMERVEGSKEVGFSEMELTIKKPALGKDGTMVVGGNFDVLAGQISSVVEKYKGTVLTDDNVNYVKALKIQFQKLRSGIEMKRKDWKKIYITTPSKLLDAMCDDLQHIIAEGEDALGSQLEAYDQKRKDELTDILKGYVEDAVKLHNLREEYACLVVLKDKYYNKTQREEDSANDIELQAEEAEKKQKEYDAGLELIKAELEGTLLVESTYTEQLKYRSAMEIVLQIKADKKASQKLYEDMKAKEAEGKKITVGETVDEGLKNFLEDDTTKAQLTDEKYGDVRERTLMIRYRKEVVQDILDFFTEHGIEYKFLK